NAVLLAFSSSRELPTASPIGTPITKASPKPTNTRCKLINVCVLSSPVDSSRARLSKVGRGASAAASGMLDSSIRVPIAHSTTSTPNPARPSPSCGLRPSRRSDPSLNPWTEPLAEFCWAIVERMASFRSCSGGDGFFAGEGLGQTEGRRTAVVQDGLLDVAVIDQVLSHESGIQILQERVLAGHQRGLQFAYELFGVAGEGVGL